MSSSKSYEWFEILEPKTQKHVFVNSLSGKCQWKKPDKFQQLADNQWWELLDFKSNNFYYYNTQTMMKTWIKPNASNFVSLVKLQVVKERKKKSFVDKNIQTSFENICIDNDYPVCAKDLDRSDISLDNIETSGYSTYKSNGTNVGHCKYISPHSDNADKPESYATLPMNRTRVPFTNPHYSRHSSTARLSQPLMGLFDEVHTEGVDNSDSLSNDFFGQLSHGSSDQHIYESCTSINGSTNSELASPLSVTRVPAENHYFPRNSVINAIERGISVNTEIWSSGLFIKSGSHLAGIKTWTGKSIPDSLLAATPKAYKKKASENFKQIQMYMGDRESRVSKELLALAICRRGISSTPWSNEIFMQLCKQVTYNPSNEKTFNGWELICICLMFFHPEAVEMKTCFKSFLEQYSCVDKTLDMDMLSGQDFNSKSIFCARISLKLLEMSHRVTEINANDILEAKKSYASSTIFFSSLNEVMDMQRRFYADLKLPWIQVALTKEILRCDGARTQGILRIPSEMSKIDSLCDAIEKTFKADSVIDIRELSSSCGCDPLLDKILDDLQFEHDPLLLSSVLKYWLRHFRDPLISFGEGSDSLAVIAKDYTKILEKINTIPDINFLVLKYLVYFLQVLGRPENVAFTNMPVENLVTLMAPTLFKLDFIQLQPAMQLLQSLIENLDTSDMASMY